MSDPRNHPNQSDTSDPSDPGRQNHLSVNRRIFFRQILGLGLDQLDRAGKQIGRRMGDFVENKREEAGTTPPTAKRESPGNTQAREDGSKLETQSSNQTRNPKSETE
ncbi:MAG: hypothetical protein WC058_14885 [Phycisphaeraceae bacterium]